MQKTNRNAINKLKRICGEVTLAAASHSPEKLENSLSNLLVQVKLLCEERTINGDRILELAEAKLSKSKK